MDELHTAYDGDLNYEDSCDNSNMDEFHTAIEGDLDCSETSPPQSQSIRIVISPQLAPPPLYIVFISI